ncbi:hypothetical protein GTA62_21555 [Roseobacter sp. HKCCD9010]|uniref:hypothetical protein n=1 Tax=unclassified Roseobacter TaxID=196798 RepID=UPI001491E3B0|nr:MULTISPECIES: hypothetical protein [unclassified Roseobacter]MBF9052340.1 hypothetical protein [Rhodobacterales bacterium HKCCD4356]NNV14488.1 hypothetical protein [Roseobacter sp. HKCCD7357]NNV18771.1 hypothetical protein [Roseobacter sp. HKCCD8768]NNV28198.1 hypothetical protein [Roseobacter sp. HKCCD8192]NNV32482.1 hypothetical protein [Roseobacter sp. HKCCD9061]
MNVPMLEEMLQAELGKINDFIDKTDEALRDAKEKRQALERTIAVYTGQPGHSGFDGNVSRGATLNDQILALLSKDRAGFAPREIARLLTESGRETKNTQVSTRLYQMKKAGLVAKLNGKWFLTSVLPEPKPTSD